MGYTRFCEQYGACTVANNLAKRIEHKAGMSCEVDWSGPTLSRGLVAGLMTPCLQCRLPARGVR